MRKGELLANLFFIGMPIIGLVAAIIGMNMAQQPTPYIWISFFLYIVGFVFFASAKWSVIKSGKLISFGTSYMSTKDAKAYKLGYSLMGVGFVITWMLIIVRTRF